MATQKKTLINELKNLIEDVMDNYEKYNETEKGQVKNALQTLQNLNESLDHYDKRLKNIFDKVKQAFNNFFGG